MEDMNRLKRKGITSLVKKQKERHIVTWTKEEDDTLREQIDINGTESWALIASKFVDKSTRQCRRRWYTYLNSDFKKGGWSPEEDKLLCEAQKQFGNRWTEIAKVVSGRTDNAVKNRFNTLLKKEAKLKELSKENIKPNNSLNNKMGSLHEGLAADGSSEYLHHFKKMRTDIFDSTETHKQEGHLHGELGKGKTRQLRTPLRNLDQVSCNVGGSLARRHVDPIDEAVGQSRVQRKFLEKNDPKFISLMQQEELLSSLAIKVKKENTDQSFDSAWKELQEYMNQSNGELQVYMSQSNGNQHERHENSPTYYEEMEENLGSSNMENQLDWRQPDLYESPATSEYSTGSTLQSHTAGDRVDETQSEGCSLYQGNWPQSNLISLESCGICENHSTGKYVTDMQTQSVQTELECTTDNWTEVNLLSFDNCGGVCENGSTSNYVASIQSHSSHTDIEMSGSGGGCVSGFPIGTHFLQVSNVPTSNEPEIDGIDSGLQYLDFNSPPHVTPIFRAMADAIPTPQFSESERNLLRKAFGLETPTSPNPSTNPSQPPPACKKNLIHNL